MIGIRGCAIFKPPITVAYVGEFGMKTYDKKTIRFVKNSIDVICTQVAKLRPTKSNRFQLTLWFCYQISKVSQI